MNYKLEPLFRNHSHEDPGLRHRSKSAKEIVGFVQMATFTHLFLSIRRTALSFVAAPPASSLIFDAKCGAKFKGGGNPY